MSAPMSRRMLRTATMRSPRPMFEITLAPTHFCKFYIAIRSLDLAAPPTNSHWGSQASHADDIEYVFGTLDTLPGVVWRPEDYALSEQMMGY